MKYPIKSKEGFPILTANGAAIPLHGIKDIIASSSADEQIRLCEELGIHFLSDCITVTFKERGKAYTIPDEDRNVIDENETEASFHLRFCMAIDRDKFPLKIAIKLDEFTDQPFVNFLGEIKFYNHENTQVLVPLTGRGTAALEGKVNDAHAGLCTSSAGASFQQRVAILSSILACFEITRDDIEIFRIHLLKICSRYLGTEEMLSYTIEKAFSLINQSYFDYMKNIYVDKDEQEIPLMLNHFIDFGEPHPVYFYELAAHLTSSEIDNELKDISNYQGPDENPISLKVRDIVNKFILSDDIYLIKPYPGNFHINLGDSVVTIYDVANEFNSNSLDRSLSILEKMGVMVTDDAVVISFVESGKKYVANKHKFDISDKISDEMFHLNLKRKSQNTDSLLKLKIFLDIKAIDNVNFFGKIEIKHSRFRRCIIPLVGRGTIALEGSLNDKHKGFCTGGDCASFLQRIAIIYCSLVLLDVDSYDLNLFETNIKSINNRCHGRHQIVDYIFKVVKEEETVTYFEYMKRTNMDYSSMPIVLKTILTYNRLPSKYYEDLISKYTEEELLKEEQLFDKSKSMNLFFGAVRQARLFIRNLNIF